MEFYYPKPTRVVDEALLERVRRQYCCACGSGYKIHPHHVTSRGAGGDDVENNVMPLCFEHHRHWHDKGVLETCKKFPGVKEWLEYHGRGDLIAKARTKREGY